MVKPTFLSITTQKVKLTALKLAKLKALREVKIRSTSRDKHLITIKACSCNRLPDGYSHLILQNVLPPTSESLMLEQKNFLNF